MTSPAGAVAQDPEAALAALRAKSAQDPEAALAALRAAPANASACFTAANGAVMSMPS